LVKADFMTRRICGSSSTTRTFSVLMAFDLP
jgi:hypothetical protein